MTTLLGWFGNLVRFFSSSISKKIIIPYAVLTLVLAALGVFVVVEQVAISFEARLKNQLQEAAQIVSDEIVNRERLRLEIERVVANTIGVADAMINRDTGTLEELISPVIANARIIDSIIIVDTQGKELLRFQREGVGSNMFVNTQAGSGADLSQWDAVREVLVDSGGGKSIQLVKDPVLDALIIYTIGPVRTADGTVGAALVGTYLENELATLQNLALAHLTLFDYNGHVMDSTFALKDDEVQEQFSFFTPERYRQIVESKTITLLDQASLPEQDEASGTVNIREQGYRLAYAPFILRDKTYGVYAVALRTNFITEATNSSRNFLIALFTLGVVTVFGIGYFVSHRISRPILRLVRTSQAISDGDLDRRTGLQRDDEIGILAATFDDMTTELQRLLQIQEEEASRLNAILSSIADGVVVQDLTGEAVVMNPAAQKILLEMEHSFLHESLQKVADDEAGKAQVEAKPESLIEYLRSFEFRETHRFEAGEQVFSALSAPVVSSDSTRLGSVVVLRNITREHESEKLKDDFITSMSHELRTPLTAIKGYNELLKLTTSGQLDNRQTGFIDTIGENVDDLLEIIQQMLDLSQIDAGNLGIDKEPLNFKVLVEEELNAWTAKMAERDMEFTAQLPADDVWVEGDENRLTRVLHNLIKNAHSYTLPGGQVAINVTQENGAVQVDVKDTGVGISPENQRFLFTRFFRAIHEEHTFEISGAGLGLYTSKAIVEAHGGRMWMKSQPDQGSTFSFALSTVNR